MSTQGVGKYFIFIKNRVTCWKDLAWCLEFTTPDIENIDTQHRTDKARCMELLKQWHTRKGNAATIHVLMEALQDADLQLVVDSLKDKYPELKEKPELTAIRRLMASPASSPEQKVRRTSEELQCSGPVLPVHLQLGVAPQTSPQGDISIELSARILELERTLFTIDVLRDPGRYKETRTIFLKHKALLKKAVKGSIILLLTFLCKTDVDRFYHNHYRVGEGTLSQQLSHILISDDLQDKVKGAQLIVRLQVKHEDYVRVRERLGKGLDRTTSVDNLLALPPPSKHVDRSRLRGLDLAVIGREELAVIGREELAVIGREDQLCADVTDDITMPYRQVQSVVRTARQKSKQEVKVQLETMQGQVETGRQKVDAMMKEVKMLKGEKEKAEKILLVQKTTMTQLQKTNKSMEARIEELLTAKGGRRQKHLSRSMSEQYSMHKSKATSTEQVEYSVVQGFGSTGVERPWVKKITIGGFVNYPLGVAVSKDNEVYIADGLNTRIQVFKMDGVGVYIREFTTTLPGETGEKLSPHDVAVDRNDNLWVVGYDHVVQYSREGTCLATIDLPHVVYLRGIAVAMATEQVIVTEYDGENGRLRVFNQDGSKVGTYDSGQRSPKSSYPRSVAVDGKGNILVTDSNNHCVHVLDRQGNFKFKFGSSGWEVWDSEESQLKHPRSICVDGMGNIIVADYGNGRVKKFDSQGRFLCHIGSAMKAPNGVGMSPGGDVVVTDFGDLPDHTVSVWTQG